MKKLSLGKLNLLSEETLQREELKIILGGGVSGSSCGTCTVPNPVTGNYDSCFENLPDRPDPCLCTWRGAGSGC